MNLPDEIYGIIHEYLKLPSSITVTKQNIKDAFMDNCNLEIILCDTNKSLDNYKNDLHKLFLLVKKYYYYEHFYERKEPIRTILIDLLCTECTLPFALSSHSVFTDITFNDLKEIIRIAPESLKTEYGQLRCRYKLSPLDIACNNAHVPLHVIEYILDKGADMYHVYEVNGYKTHVLDDINPGDIAPVFARKRYEKIKQLFLNKGFDEKELKIDLCFQ